ncbi:MAG: X2-like carbohydrate binding domain-containing protein [Erysipelotrichaceae bacterium]
MKRKQQWIKGTVMVLFLFFCLIQTVDAQSEVITSVRGNPTQWTSRSATLYFQVTTNVDAVVVSTSKETIKVNKLGTWYFFQAPYNDRYTVNITTKNQTQFQEVIVVDKIDKTAPTGQIIINEQIFTDDSDDLHPRLFVKDIANVRFTGADLGSGVASIDYQLVDDPHNYSLFGKWSKAEDLALDVSTKTYVYARIIDHAGNRTIINTHGVVVYEDASLLQQEGYFDLDPENSGHSDLFVPMALNNNAIASITYKGNALRLGMDYELVSDGILLKKEYLMHVVREHITLNIQIAPLNETYIKEVYNDAPKELTYTVYEVKHVEKPRILTSLDQTKLQFGFETAEELQIKATVEQGTLSYQWYCDEQAIPNATTSSYTPQPQTSGTYRYTVVVTNTDPDLPEQKNTTVSDVYTLIVSDVGIDEHPNITVPNPTLLWEAIWSEVDTLNVQQGVRISLRFALEQVEVDEQFMTNYPDQIVKGAMRLVVHKTTTNQQGQIQRETITPNHAVPLLVSWDETTQSTWDWSYDATSLQPLSLSKEGASLDWLGDGIYVISEHKNRAFGRAVATGLVLVSVVIVVVSLRKRAKQSK